MPYVAQRRLTMGGIDFGPPGNAYDLPHILPAELVERTPFRSLNNLLMRGVIKQVEVLPQTPAPGAPPRPSGDPKELDVLKDPRVTVEGYGWYLVDGERVHGRKAVEAALQAGG